MEFLTFLRGVSLADAMISALDIAIVYYVVYRALLLIKGTRGAQMLLGVVLVGIGLFAAKLLELTTVTWLLDNLLNYVIIFFIVIFQHDIRRGLTRVGQNLFARARNYEQTSVFEEVIRAAERLSHARIGGLIVFERDADLTEFLNEGGVEMDAKVTEQLLVSLFLPDSENKLHDGAVIVRNLRLALAGAVLPLSGNAKLDKELGTRHRAAIGITEETDAVVVVVSEQKGTISLCFGGNIARDLDGPTLRKALLGLFQKDRRRKAAGDRTRRTGQVAAIDPDKPTPTQAASTAQKPPELAAAPGADAADPATVVDPPLAQPTEAEERATLLAEVVEAAKESG